MTREEWTKRVNGYFIASCRKWIRWSPAYRAVLKRTLVKKDSKGEWYKCEKCGELVLRKFKQVDHINSIINRRGWNGSWDVYRERIINDTESDLQLLCKRPCHYEKTQKENAERRKAKKKREEK